MAELFPSRNLREEDRRVASEEARKQQAFFEEAERRGLSVSEETVGLSHEVTASGGLDEIVALTRWADERDTSLLELFPGEEDDEDLAEKARREVGDLVYVSGDCWGP